jgi:hypothetical protein
MNYKKISEYLGEHDVVLEESFSVSLRNLAKKQKKKLGLRTLDKMYALIGCIKVDISRWEYNPCSTQATSRNAKIAAVNKAATVFGLDIEQSEALANKAGLSLAERYNGLYELMTTYTGKNCDLLAKAGVSERMFQYYLAGKEPTKQALLAISVSFGLSLADIDSLLHKYGYCLSRSLPNDAVVLYFLQNHRSEKDLLFGINEVLGECELSPLATKIYGE